MPGLLQPPRQKRLRVWRPRAIVIDAHPFRAGPIEFCLRIRLCHPSLVSAWTIPAVHSARTYMEPTVRCGSLMMRIAASPTCEHPAGAGVWPGFEIARCSGGTPPCGLAHRITIQYARREILRAAGCEPGEMAQRGALPPSPAH